MSLRDDWVTAQNASDVRDSSIASRYPARFIKYVDATLDSEGGFNNGHGDPGGVTMWGISSRSYPHLKTKIKNRTLSRDEAVAIYYNDFYAATPHIEHVEESIGFFIFDSRVQGAMPEIRQIRDFLSDEGVSIAEKGLITVGLMLALTKIPKYAIKRFYTFAESGAPYRALTQAKRNVMKTGQGNVMDIARGLEKRIMDRIRASRKFLYDQ